MIATFVRQSDAFELDVLPREGEKSTPILLGLSLFLLVTTVGTYVTPAAGLAISIGLVVHAIRGPRQALEALSLLAFMLLLSGANVSMTRWVILFAAFGRTLWDTIALGHRTPPLLKGIVIFGITILVFSITSSALPLVSVFKLLSFTLGVGTVVTLFYRTRELRSYWLAWFLTMGLFILLASTPLYFLSLGYLRNGVGFQGILSHPQTYGPVVAPIAALLTSWVFFYKDRRPLIIGGAALGWIGVFSSMARTSFLALAGSLLSTILAAIILNASWRRRMRGAFSSLGLALVIMMTAGFAFSYSSSIQSRLIGFMMKDEMATTVVDALQSSRSTLITRSMENFRTHPLTGIGFGVPSNPNYRRIELGPLGLPVSASVEKGFMPSAVLEETGVVGAVFVLLLLIQLYWPALRRGEVWLFWMMLTALLINGGEMVFFSVGGMGFYFWILLGFCHTYAEAEPQRKPDA